MSAQVLSVKWEERSPAPVAAAKPVTMQPVWPPGNRMAAPPQTQPLQERDCMRCDETFSTTSAENAEVCPKCEKNPNRVIEVKAETTVTANEPPPPVAPAPAATPAVDARLASVMAAIQDLAKPQAAAVDEKHLREVVEQVVAETMGKVVHAVIHHQLKKFMEHASTFTGE